MRIGLCIEYRLDSIFWDLYTKVTIKAGLADRTKIRHPKFGTLREGRHIHINQH